MFFCLIASRKDTDILNGLLGRLDWKGSKASRRGFALFQTLITTRHWGEIEWIDGIIASRSWNGSCEWIFPSDGISNGARCALNCVCVNILQLSISQKHGFCVEVAITLIWWWFFQSPKSFAASKDTIILMLIPLWSAMVTYRPLALHVKSLDFCQCPPNAWLTTPRLFRKYLIKRWWFICFFSQQWQQFCATVSTTCWRQTQTLRGRSPGFVTQMQVNFF